MSFRRRNCAIPRLWCGNGKVNFRKKVNDGFYSREGTRYECLKIGFGAGKHSLENPSSTSLKNIKYIGEIYEDSFRRKDIGSLKELKRVSKKMTVNDFKRLLQQILKKKDGTVDNRAYNSVLIYLDDVGIKKLPACYAFTRPSKQDSNRSTRAPSSDGGGSHSQLSDDSTDEIIL